ncbi:cell wall adhesin EAP1-like [Rhopalosiphum maidis]|uniref:cell wall adhesin EAP1-like n=1 Tax=Rhopalosiphum maidis TaxID=43146 RepID=UPI000EFE0E44|nr:cell wall adhesin EAP1-like [Rhopalosiphum maidis]
MRIFNMECLKMCVVVGLALTAVPGRPADAAPPRVGAYVYQQHKRSPADPNVDFTSALSTNFGGFSPSSTLPDFGYGSGFPSTAASFGFNDVPSGLLHLSHPFSGTTFGSGFDSIGYPFSESTLNQLQFKSTLGSGSSPSLPVDIKYNPKVSNPDLQQSRFYGLPATESVKPTGQRAVPLQQTGPNEQRVPAESFNSALGSFAPLQQPYPTGTAFVPQKQLYTAAISVPFQQSYPSTASASLPQSYPASTSVPQQQTYSAISSAPQQQSYPATVSASQQQSYVTEITAPIQQSYPAPASIQQQQSYLATESAQQQRQQQSYSTSASVQQQQQYPIAESVPQQQSYSTSLSIPQQQSYSSAISAPFQQPFSTITSAPQQSYPASVSIQQQQSYPASVSVQQQQTYPAVESVPQQQSYPATTTVFQQQSYPATSEDFRISSYQQPADSGTAGPSKTSDTGSVPDLALELRPPPYTAPASPVDYQSPPASSYSPADSNKDNKYPVNDFGLSSAPAAGTSSQTQVFSTSNNRPLPGNTNDFLAARSNAKPDQTHTDVYYTAPVPVTDGSNSAPSNAPNYYSVPSISYSLTSTANGGFAGSTSAPPAAPIGTDRSVSAANPTGGQNPSYLDTNSIPSVTYTSSNSISANSYGETNSIKSSSYTTPGTPIAVNPYSDYKFSTENFYGDSNSISLNNKRESSTVNSSYKPPLRIQYSNDAGDYKTIQ